MTTSHHSDTAFQATFASFRLVQGRKVAQLIFEVPIEAADNALSVLGGVPNPEQTRWVGIARIDPKATKPKLSGKDLWRASSECAMLCKEPDFWAYLGTSNEQEATEFVRNLLGIESRRELDQDSDAVHEWGKLKARYDRYYQAKVRTGVI
jgi:hypothetical protein